MAFQILLVLSSTVWRAQACTAVVTTPDDLVLALQVEAVGSAWTLPAANFLGLSPVRRRRLVETLQVSWGDGTPESTCVAPEPCTHVYAAPGVFSVIAKGAVAGWAMTPTWHTQYTSGDVHLLQIAQWGGLQLDITAGYHFYGEARLVEVPPLSQLDTSQVTNFAYSFSGLANATFDVSDLRARSAQVWRGAFADSPRLAFSDVGAWNMSAAVDTAYMFAGTQAPVIGGLERWNLSRVSNATGMFARAAVSADLSQWTLHSLQDAPSILQGAPPALLQATRQSCAGTANQPPGCTVWLPSASASTSVSATQTASSTASATASASTSVSTTLTASSTASATVSPSATRSATPAASSTTSATVSPSATRSATPTASSTTSATGSPSATISTTPTVSTTPTASKSLGASDSGTATVSVSRSLSASGSPSPSASASGSPSPSASASGSPSPSASASGSPSPSASASGSPSPSASASGSPSSSASASGSPSSSASASGSPSPSASASSSPSPSATASTSFSASGSPSISISASVSVSASVSATASPTSTPLTTGAQQCAQDLCVWAECVNTAVAAAECPCWAASFPTTSSCARDLVVPEFSYAGNSDSPYWAFNQSSGAGTALGVTDQGRYLWLRCSYTADTVSVVHVFGRQAELRPWLTYSLSLTARKEPTAANAGIPEISLALGNSGESFVFKTWGLAGFTDTLGTLVLPEITVTTTVRFDRVLLRFWGPPANPNSGVQLFALQIARTNACDAIVNCGQFSCAALSTSEYNCLSPTPTCSLSPTISPSPSTTASPSLTPTVSLTATVSLTPTASLTPTVSLTPFSSLTATVSLTPTPSTTASSSPSLTATVSLTPTLSVSASVSVTPSVSLTPSITASSSLSLTASVSLTPTLSVSASVSVTPSVSLTPSITVSPSTTPSTTASSSPSLTASVSLTPTLSVSASVSVTPSVSLTSSITVSPSTTPSTTESSSPSLTASVSLTPTLSVSASVSVTPSVTRTPTISLTPSTTVTPSPTPTLTVTPTTSPDINECTTTTLCQWGDCVNTYGSYTCTCWAQSFAPYTGTGCLRDLVLTEFAYGTYWTQSVAAVGTATALTDGTYGKGVQLYAPNGASDYITMVHTFGSQLVLKVGLTYGFQVQGIKSSIVGIGYSGNLEVSVQLNSGTTTVVIASNSMTGIPISATVLATHTLGSYTPTGADLAFNKMYLKYMGTSTAAYSGVKLFRFRMNNTGACAGVTACASLSKVCQLNGDGSYSCV